MPPSLKVSLPSNQKLKKVRAALKKVGIKLKTQHMGYWKLDLETQVLKWSDEQYRIYGYEPQELKPDSNFFILKTTHYSETERISKIIADALGNHNDYTFKRRIVKRNGRLGFVETNAVIIRSAEGEAIKISGTTIDVYEKKQ